MHDRGNLIRTAAIGDCIDHRNFKTVLASDSIKFGLFCVQLVHRTFNSHSCNYIDHRNLTTVLVTVMNCLSPGKSSI